MSDRNAQALADKAKAIMSLVDELTKEAEKEGFGLSLENNAICFEDWQSSACYGEADDGFTVDSDGVWYSSNC
ncbi:hypothetical protein [Escherichia phage phiWec190]|nr:hypothetical protein [Escherichia phage phiWec188]BDU13640.1 hypothetical protein [Escherichia phage phiWec190]